MTLLPVGIDISKDTLDVCVYFDGQGHQVGQFANSPDGFAELALKLEPFKDSAGANQIHLVCEPTGLKEQPWSLSLISKIGW